jgi:hemin uptake protein HemP
LRHLPPSKRKRTDDDCRVTSEAALRTVLTDDLFGDNGELAVDHSGGNRPGVGAGILGEEVPGNWSPQIIKAVAVLLGRMPSKKRKVIWKELGNIALLTGEEVIRADNGFSVGLDREARRVAFERDVVDGMMKFRVKNPRADASVQARHEFLLRTSYAVKQIEAEALFAFSVNGLEWFKYLGALMTVQKSAELMGAETPAAKSYLTDVSKPDEIVHLQAAFGGSTDSPGRNRVPQEARGSDYFCHYCQNDSHTPDRCFRDPYSPAYRPPDTFRAKSDNQNQNRSPHHHNGQGGGRQSRPVSRPQNGTGNASNNNHFQRRAPNNNNQSRSRQFSPLGQGNSMQPFSVPAPAAPSPG